MRASQWALTQCDWSIYRKRTFGPRDRHAQRENYMESQGEHHVQGKECLRIQRAKREARTNSLSQPPEGSSSADPFLFKPPKFTVLCYGCPRTLIHKRRGKNHANNKLEGGGGMR